MTPPHAVVPPDAEMIQVGDAILGFSLPEIRELLVLRRDDGEACSHVRDLLLAKVDTIRNKILELGVLEEQLTKNLRKCERELRAAGDSHKGCCPVIEEIAQQGSK